MRIKTIKDINLKRMRVFLRADMNVPLENGAILDDYRIRATLPTIDYIIKNGGKVILATHMGQPDIENKTNFFDEKLSTQILATWFKNHGYEVDYEVDLLLAQKKSYQHPKHILLLENLRFFHGEKALDVEFAELLADLGDVYINDAFGLIHRPDTSITLLAEQFIDSNKAAGLLIEQEITHLNKLKQNPEQPFIIVLGGNKIDTKIELLNAYLETPHMPQTIILGSAIAIPFLQAQGLCTQTKNIDKHAIETAKNFMQKARTKKLEILLPQDFVTTRTPFAPSSSSGLRVSAHAEPVEASQLSTHTPENIPAGYTGVDIGPKTIDLYKNKIAQARTIFVNGTMGIYENPTYATGSKEILEAITHTKTNTKTYIIAGGGDTVSAIHAFGLEKDFNHISTGGGATLAYLAQQDPYTHFRALKLLIDRTNSYNNKTI